jgi:hypothetical protein
VARWHADPMGTRVVTAVLLLGGGYRVGCDCGGPVVPGPYDAGSAMMSFTVN